jgi:hypothetical protein
MMKNQVAAGWLLSAAAGLSLATAQSSPVHPLSPNPHSYYSQPAAKPPAPKSVMPAKRKPSVAAPSANKSTGSANAELTRLERQPVKANNGMSAPAAGAKAATPNSKPASTPRVTNK